MSNHSKRQMSLMSLAVIGLSIVLVSVVVYAWFFYDFGANVEPFVIDVTKGDLEYKLYAYQDTDINGNTTAKPLKDNIITAGQTDGYLQLIDPTALYIFPDLNRQLMPTDRFSFALEVNNVTDNEIKLKMDLGDVVSTGYTSSKNMIQRAFEYDVNRIAMVDLLGEEVIDLKIVPGVWAYKSWFQNTPGNYTLAEGIPVAPYNTDGDKIIIYFDLYFDPDVETVDDNNIPLGNSNGFTNQGLTIEHMFLSMMST